MLFIAHEQSRFALGKFTPKVRNQIRKGYKKGVNVIYGENELQ